ncbi:hypothetical protein B484DRAFT_35638 [Ochromonadaceae sp. CCMP2298]|nr:hypothetical protein B484DRAFT_35638 [Ochromonadaceae sp. CCMP2298]
MLPLLLLVLTLCAAALLAQPGISAAEEAAFFRDLPDERYIVLILSKLGMANRLRSMADWYHVASLSNRTLLVSWEAARGCNAKFSDLFESGPPRMHVLAQSVPAGDEGIAAVETAAQRANMSAIGLYEELETEMWARPHTSFVMRRALALSEHQVLVTTYDGITSVEDVPCQRYMKMHSQFLRDLIPTPATRDLVQEVRGLFKGRTMVGVHYRAHDAQQDWAVVPPLMGNNAAGEFGSGRTFDDFVSAMGGIQQHFAYTDHQGQPASQVRFFIASNDPQAKERLLRAAPDAVAIHGEYSRDSLGGMRFALAEWLLLAQSQLILNTYGSSFAEQAAMVKERPLVGVWEGELVHHHSMFLPYCGHLQFVKAAGRQGTRHSYKEGYDREIDGVALPLQHSGMLAAWGLPSVLVTSDDTRASVETQRTQQQEAGAEAGAGDAADPSEPVSEEALQKAMALSLTSDEGEFAVIGRKTGTDKLTQHGYHRFYPRFLEHFRSLRGAAMLEIGMDKGFSMNLWVEYFPHAFVYGVDKDVQQSGERYAILQADQGDREQMARVMEKVKHPLFLVLDDGSHIPAHQVQCFDQLFSALQPGGVYIVEDMELSYWTRPGMTLYGHRAQYGYRDADSAMELFQALAADVNWEFMSNKHRAQHERIVGGKVSMEVRRQISSITFAQNCIVVMKKTAQEQAYNDRHYRFIDMFDIHPGDAVAAAAAEVEVEVEA